MPQYDLILASGSPRRKQLMTELGFDYTVITADIDESPSLGESPLDLASRLARQKADAVHRKLSDTGNQRVIIAADTIVAMDNILYGKPADESDANRMLRQLRDGWHQVHSAVCVMDVSTRACHARLNTTQIRMRDYSSQEIADYVGSRDPLDKAGAYAIQHPGFAPVSAIDGCITGVMGLPLADLRDLLEAFGIRTRCQLAPICERQAAFGCCQRNK